jgi:DNA-binding transcriptional LysR family regulator
MKQGLSMQRGALDGVEAFLRVAERRSFTAAATDLGVSPSAISQTIRALEERVGVPLLIRTTRSVGLTQAGEVFLEQAAPAFDGLNSAFEATRTLAERPAGLLRITMMRAVIPHLFEPLVPSFFDAYPEIELDICAEDKFVDLAEGGFDAGVRLGESIDADMIAVRLTDPFKFVIAASPSYLDRFGTPETLADLKDHRAIRIRMPTGAMMPWQFMLGNRMVEAQVTGPLIVNDFMGQMAAAQQGAGLIYTAEPVLDAALAAGQLKIVMPDHSLTSGGVFLYYPSRRQVMPKLRAFIDYIRAHMPGSGLVSV